MNVKKCRTCGALVDAEDLFCDQCGASLFEKETNTLAQNSYSKPRPEENKPSIKDKEGNIKSDYSSRKEASFSYQNMTTQNSFKRHLPKIIAGTVCFLIIVCFILSKSTYIINYFGGGINEEIPNFRFSEQMITVNDFNTYPLIFNNELVERDQIKIGYTIFPEEGDLTGTFICWVRSEGEWTQIGSFEIYETEEEYINTFFMDPPLSFDALVITPEYFYEGENLIWTDEYTSYP